MTRLLALTVFAIFLVPAFASPARACSCATPQDIETWVGESPAAFVGTLVDKRNGGQGEFGAESIYVFEVEEWVKGDVGDVIEVRSASDGAACGFEFWDPDQRIGAVLQEKNGELHSGLCSQVDPDVLLAAMEEPTESRTGLGHLLVADWLSPRLAVLDEVGAQVTELSPPGAGGWASTELLDVCPDGDLMLQLTGREISVWDLSTLEWMRNHDVSRIVGEGWVNDLSCDDPAAESIHLLVGSEESAKLFRIASEVAEVMELEGIAGKIGNGFVISQHDHEGDATWVDITNGQRTTLTRTPPNRLVAVSIAPHPTEQKIALVQTTFREGGPVDAILSIVDHRGSVVERFEIPGETYSPTWLDEDRVAVKAFHSEDWENSSALVFDLASGQMDEVPGWGAETTIADGRRLYGVTSGSVVTAELGSADIETLVTLPTQSAGPLVLLEESPRASPTTTITAPFEDGFTRGTIPPLVVVSPSVDDEAGGSRAMQWLAGGAIAVVIGILVWMALRRSTT